MSASVAIGQAPVITYRIRGGSSIDLDKLSVRVTYTRTAADGSTVNYDRTFTSADTANIYKQGSFAFIKFDGLGLTAGDVDVNFVATYDGAEVFNSVYSVGDMSLEVRDSFFVLCGKMYSASNLLPALPLSQ